MKLYTEEQLKDAFIRGVLKGMAGSTISTNDLFEMYITELTPIELPSDEEIEKVAEKKLSVNLIGFIIGAKWMKEQILGKEDKTFKQKSKWTEVDNMTRRLK